MMLFSKFSSGTCVYLTLQGPIEKIILKFVTFIIYCFDLENKFVIFLLVKARFYSIKKYNTNLISLWEV